MTRASHDRTLILLRHAKAEQGSGVDAERKLTERGVRDAKAAGRWIAEHGYGADEVLCSPAVRTTMTCDAVATAGCSEAEVRHDRRIYNASPEALLEVLHDAPEDANVVLLVGHAPGLPSLASLLADGKGSTIAHEHMSEGFPTSGIAVLSYAGAWSELGFADARLERFGVGRG
jgi:phosphohistidine phosphatase